MELFRSILKSWDIDINGRQLDQFDQYYRLLIDRNSKVNLTSITDINEVYVKHFADSIALLRSTDLNGISVIDVGSGAGFPGIPLAVMCPDCDIVLVDSLMKRIDFLNDVINELGLSKVRCVHGRVEDLGHDQSYRERFDLAVSRAVAKLDTLCEYCLPFVKTGGMFISYKSGNIEAEIIDAGNSLTCIGGKISKTEFFEIPETDLKRSFIYISKTNNTDIRYPRRAGLPSKKPL